MGPCGGLGRGVGRRARPLTYCLPTRLHWCGKGCHGVHCPRGAALHLPDHLSGPPAPHHRVWARALLGGRLLGGARALLTPLVLCVYRGSRRPGGMASTYGRTPMYGSQTPMYGSGSRTPMYGSQTPLQDGERSRQTGMRGDVEGSGDRTELMDTPLSHSRQPYPALWLSDSPA